MLRPNAVYRAYHIRQTTEPLDFEFAFGSQTVSGAGSTSRLAGIVDRYFCFVVWGVAMKRWIWTAIFVSVLSSLSLPARAQFDGFIGFGDSTLDSGWFKGALTGQCGSVAAPCTTGNA